MVRTLRNAVRSGRVAHAYLFTGPRGTGKTSTARVLVKAINCLDPQDGAPCTRCAMCISIAEGRSPDVIEIDGASNTGIEDIRVLRERVAYTPAEGRYKAYIIDEVHRLSGNAFDGLLKTLEEHPRHVVLVFASTEPHKLPATILSRCQRFDFRKIGREDTVARLREVAAEEHLTVDDDALLLITQQSGGSLRDALGALDQVRAFAGDHVTSELVRESVGLGRPAVIAALTDAIIGNNPGAGLGAIHESVDAGADARMLSRQLIEHWRALLLQVSGAGEEADIDPALQELLPQQAKHLTSQAALDVLRALTEEIVEPRLSVAPELPLELAIVQATLVLHPEQRHPHAQPAPQGGELSGSMGKETGPTPPQKPDPGPVEPESPPAASEPSAESSPADAGSMEPPNSSEIKQDPAHSPELGAQDVLPPEAESVESPSATPVANVSRLAASPAEGDWSPSWQAALEIVRGRSQRLQAVLRSATVVAWSESEVTLGFRHKFHRDQSDLFDNRSVVEEVLAQVTGSRRPVRSVLVDGPGPSANMSDDDTDAFVEEAERMLRGIHARQIKGSRMVDG